MNELYFKMLQGIAFGSSPIAFHGLEPLSRKKSASQEDSYMKSLAGFSCGNTLIHLPTPLVNPASKAAKPEKAMGNLVPWKMDQRMDSVAASDVEGAWRNVPGKKKKKKQGKN